MAEKNTKIEFEISGKDVGLSNAVGKALGEAENKARASSRRMQSLPTDTGQVFGPAVRDRYGERERTVRQMTAGRVRAARDQARRASLSEEVDRRLFGEERKPIREVNRSIADQGFRDERARMLRELRQDRGGGSTPVRRMVGRVGGGEGFGGGGGGGGDAAAGSLLQNLRRQSGAVNSILRGGGAIAIAEIVGRKMQELPVVVDRYKEALSTGATKTEAVATAVADILPGVGTLARGFQAAGSALHELATGAKESERVRKEASAQRGAIVRNRDERRAGQVDALNQAGGDARRRLEDIGDREGPSARAEERAAKRRLDRELEQIAADDAKTRNLAPGEQTDKARQQQADRRAAANAEYGEAVAKAGEERRKAEAEAERSIEDERRQLAAEGRQAQLEDEGKTTEAIIAGIEARAEERKIAIQRELEEARKTYEEGDYELLRLEARAKQRMGLVDEAAGREANRTRTSARRDDYLGALSRAEEIAREQTRPGDINRGSIGGESRLGSVLTAKDTFSQDFSKQNQTLKAVQDEIKRADAKQEARDRTANELLRQIAAKLQVA